MSNVDYDFALKCLQNAEESPLAGNTSMNFPSQEQFTAMNNALDAWKTYWKATHALYDSFTERAVTEVNDLKLNDSNTTTNGTSKSPITTPRRPHE